VASAWVKALLNTSTLIYCLAKLPELSHQSSKHDDHINRFVVVEFKVRTGTRIISPGALGFCGMIKSFGCPPLLQTCIMKPLQVLKKKRRHHTQ